MENTEYLKTIFIFRELTGMELIKFNKVLKTEHAKKGAIIITEGDAADKMYVVKKGAVDIYKGEGLNKTKVTHLLPGAHFGEVALIDSNPRSASVVALEDTELLSIERKEFQALLTQNETIALKIYKAFTRALCDRLRQANENLIVAHQLHA
jgi:CRP-like cAMP-binding protein